MSYIITQSEDIGIEDIDSFDAMIDEESEKLQVFEEYEDAVAFLMCHGIRELSSGFPFNIKIEKLQ
tara:strand:+ start:3420 stop:3617 length:198 start_codon:yes stop_codon:yes gene_type:complete